MVSIIGTYQNGYLKLDKDYPTSAPVKVIVTFLEEVKSNSQSQQGMTLADFSFAKSKENLKSFEGSFSETVIAERRTEL